MSAKVSPDEFMESLTGFDELAIEKKFSASVLDLAQNRPTTFVRSLVFVIRRREGDSDAEAYESVMNMSLGEVQGHFEESDEEVMPEEPESESGKGDSQPG